METEPTMMPIDQKKKYDHYYHVLRFRERMGKEQYCNYMKPYCKTWNAKEETKATRKIKNAEYYQRKKAERLNMAISEIK